MRITQCWAEKIDEWFKTTKHVVPLGHFLSKAFRVVCAHFQVLASIYLHHPCNRMSPSQSLHYCFGRSLPSVMALTPPSYSYTILWTLFVHTRSPRYYIYS